MHSCKECQFSLHVYNNGSGLNCWQILIFTSAYALIFRHRRFGSLFWLLWVLIRSLFHKKWVLTGSLSQSLGVFISFRGSAYCTWDLPPLVVVFIQLSPDWTTSSQVGSLWRSTRTVYSQSGFLSRANWCRRCSQKSRDWWRIQGIAVTWG